MAGPHAWSRSGAAILSMAAGLLWAATGRIAASEPPTFARDIAPVIFDRCATCHHPGGDAPFSLLSYDEARSRARLIAAVTKSRYMPPWKSEPGSGDFIGQQHLTDDEIARIQTWVDAGAPEGDPHDLPSAPTWTSGWQLGEPDVVVALPEPYTVRAEGPDYSRTFVLRLPLERDRYARGLEFRPGPANVIHHANVRIDRTPASRTLDGNDPGPGYEGLLPPSAVFPDGHFLGWTPGQRAPLLSKGLAWRVARGTDLVVEMHFVPSGKPEVVTPTFGLYLTDEPPSRTPAMLRLGRQDIDIPAELERYVSTDAFVLPVDVELLAVQPHAHYRAREVLGTATRPDGTSTVLIDIRDWDYRWQHVYRYRQPVLLPRGTTLSMKYVFDNSSANPRNPHRPPRRVSWGQQSTDEMGDLWIQMLTRSPEDMTRLSAALQVKHMTEEAVGFETMLRADPSQVSLHNDAAVLYAELGQSDKAAAHFETAVRLQPLVAAAHFNFATALSSLGRSDDAVREFEEALRLRPAYGAAHNNLGQVLLSQGKIGDAEVHFRAAARLDSAAAGPHYNLGVIARARGDVPEALDRFRTAVRLEPDGVEPLTYLAWLLATASSVSPADADEAVRLAERAVSLTGRRRADVLDVLGAAYAAVDRWTLAAAACQEALALRPDAGLEARLEQRLALYQQRRRHVSWGERHE